MLSDNDEGVAKFGKVPRAVATARNVGFIILLCYLMLLTIDREILIPSKYVLGSQVLIWVTVVSTNKFIQKRMTVCQSDATLKISI